MAMSLVPAPLPSTGGDRRLTRVCSWCQRMFDEDTGEYTATICEPCLREHFPQLAEQVLASARAAGHEPCQ